MMSRANQGDLWSVNVTATTVHASRRVQALGGWSLIVATVLFALVFAYLARAFNYPEVLDGTADNVLPKLLALGPAGRSVWVVYGLIPLLLVPTALGVRSAGAADMPDTSRLALLLANASAVCMTAGLLRWPSLHWQLAIAFEHATPTAREAMAAVFVAANSYLGNYVGEFLGELFLTAFLLCASLVLARRSGQAGLWLRRAGFIAAVCGWTAMARNVTSVVATVAAANNVLLPVWMLALGVTLVRQAGWPDEASLSRTQP